MTNIFNFPLTTPRKSNIIVASLQKIGIQMAGYVNWMQTSQPIKGDLIPIEGNPAANHTVTASGVATGEAPTGTQYVSLWSTAACTVSLSELDGLSLGAGLTYALPANFVVQFANIIPKKTTITITDI